MKVAELKDKQIAILGFGQEGKSTLNFLRNNGISDTNITVLDAKKIDSKDAPILGNINTQTGKDYIDNLEPFDVIFKSPGVSPFQEKLLPYRDRMSSQTEIFFSEYRGKVIGVTGTKGKSTIVSLVYQLLQEAGYDVKLVGNIGSPVLDEIDFSGEIHDFVIYELSSYMLQDFVPKLEYGLLNNIYPCHLDWHFQSFQIYRDAKSNVLKNAGTKIVHGDFAGEPTVAEIGGDKIYYDTKGRYSYDEKGFFIGEQYIYTGNISLPGDHNRANISAVIALLDKILAGDKERLHSVLEKVLPSFGSLPMRQEIIGTFEGITFINDAAATTPESTMAAISAFSPQLQTLFLGGQDSGFEIEKIRNGILKSPIENIIAFPDTAEKIFPEIAMRDYDVPFEIEIDGKNIQFLKTRSMQSGVDFAFRTTFPGRVALLSTAAPSFSLWKNREHKAEEFIQAVKKY